MMIVEVDGYILKQCNGHRVTYVTFPDGTEKTVIGPRLTKEAAKAIIIEASRPC